MAYIDPQVQMDNLERLLDLIAEALIQSPLINTDSVENNQKFIRNGTIQIGQPLDSADTSVSNERLVLYQKDIKANQEDLNQQTLIGDQDTGILQNLQAIADGVDFDTLSIDIQEGANPGEISIGLVGGGAVYNGENITNLIVGDGNPLNMSQFIPLQQSSSIVNVEAAEEFLDTTIYELLPTGDSRQARITRFFQELNALLPGPNSYPDFDLNADERVDRDSSGNWIGDASYNLSHSISTAQNNPSESLIEEEQAFIHRLKKDANDNNSDSTIEDIFNTIEPYLEDILELSTPPLDEREEYVNQSNGYLQFRNPNQAIIIRNTNKEFIDGLNPTTKEFLDTGFTITMWVRFLDKASNGTLFNLANNLMLETRVLLKDDIINSTLGENLTLGELSDLLDLNYFENSNSARFVRLVVDDKNGYVRTSSTGLQLGNSANGMEKNIYTGQITNDIKDIFQSTFIPEDFSEWYFICASFKHNSLEDDSLIQYPQFLTNKMFWLNHIDPTNNGAVVRDSDYGNKAKVEIISKTDLLRARGFKV